MNALQTQRNDYPVRPLLGNEGTDDVAKSSADGTERVRGEEAEAAAAAAPVDEEEDFECHICGEDIEEARKPKLLRDPGAPSFEQIEDHNPTHLPFRAWCPACVAGKAKDKMHLKQKPEVQNVPVVVFDYCFLGTNDAKETLPVQVMLDTRTGIIFGHVVPRKGMIDEHGCDGMIKDSFLNVMRSLHCSTFRTLLFKDAS